MALHIVDPPIGAYEAVRSVITRMASTGAFRTPALRRANPAALALSTPHRVAAVHLDRIRSAGDLRSIAETAGWRFLLHDGECVVASVDAVIGTAGAYRFGHLTEGPFATGTEEAIRKAEALDVVHKHDFEPSLLLVPALYVVALWLRDREGGADLAMPIPPVPPELKAFEAIGASEFLTMLHGLAERLPTRDKKGKSPSGG
jgi:hypothetical protein